MAVEKKRGCGYRKVGGIYLISEANPVVCHRFPIKLPEVCPTCSSGIKMSRAFTWIDGKALLGKCDFKMSDYSGPADDILIDPPQCHRLLGEHCYGCYPEERMGLMWVGKQFYSPESFISESADLGVSKRVAALPTGLVVGKTKVLLMHPEVIRATVEDEKGAKKEILVPGIFHGFVVTGVEVLLWQSQATEKVLVRLGKRGMTPVVIPDGDPDHTPETKPKKSVLEE